MCIFFLGEKDAYSAWGSLSFSLLWFDTFPYFREFSVITAIISAFLFALLLFRCQLRMC